MLGRRRCLLGHVDADLGSVVDRTVSIEPVTFLCLSFLSQGRDCSLTRGSGLVMRMNENQKSTRVLMLETPGSWQRMLAPPLGQFRQSLRQQDVSRCLEPLLEEEGEKHD